MATRRNPTAAEARTRQATKRTAAAAAANAPREIETLTIEVDVAHLIVALNALERTLPPAYATPTELSSVLALADQLEQLLDAPVIDHGWRLRDA